MSVHEQVHDLPESKAHEAHLQHLQELHFHNQYALFQDLLHDFSPHAI